MNKGWLNKYLYVYKTQIIRSFTYKFDVYGNIIMQAIIMLTSAFFWRALFGNDVYKNGIDAEQMITYTIVSSLMSVCLTTTVERRIEDGVQKGSVVMDMMHPVNIFGVYFAENLGTVSALIFQNFLPVLIVGSALLKIPTIASASAIPLFIIFMTGSFLINWLLAAVFGMFAFTAINMDALIQVKKHLVRLLSGSIIPLWFFPDWPKTILEALPFVYIYQLPLNIYVGGSSMTEIYGMMLVQLLWITILATVFYILQKKVIRKLMVQGG